MDPSRSSRFESSGVLKPQAGKQKQAANLSASGNATPQIQDDESFSRAFPAIEKPPSMTDDRSSRRPTGLSFVSKPSYAKKGSSESQQAVSPLCRSRMSVCKNTVFARTCFVRSVSPQAKVRLAALNSLSSLRFLCSRTRGLSSALCIQDWFWDAGLFPDTDPCIPQRSPQLLGASGPPSRL